jgi:hypothetical protein
MPILRADPTIVSLAGLGCVSYCQCQVRAVQAKLLPTLILVAAGIAGMMSGDAAVLDQLAGAGHDRLGSRLLAASLGRVAFESALSCARESGCVTVVRAG